MHNRLNGHKWIDVTKVWRHLKIQEETLTEYVTHLLFEKSCGVVIHLQIWSHKTINFAPHSRVERTNVLAWNMNHKPEMRKQANVKCKQRETQKSRVRLRLHAAFSNRMFQLQKHNIHRADPVSNVHAYNPWPYYRLQAIFKKSNKPLTRSRAIVSSVAVFQLAWVRQTNGTWRPSELEC